MKFVQWLLLWSLSLCPTFGRAQFGNVRLTGSQTQLKLCRSQDCSYRRRHTYIDRLPPGGEFSLCIGGHLPRGAPSLRTERCFPGMVHQAALTGAPVSYDMRWVPYRC